jgi:hypothetical protein
MTEKSGAHAAVRIVARFTDGRVLKGSAVNASAVRPVFSLTLASAAGCDQPATIRMSDLKAVFFVSDLTGDAAYHERQDFETRPVGRKLAVTFKDGERLVGASLTYAPARDGFFLFPADPRSNNKRIYVVMRAVARVEML